MATYVLVHGAWSGAHGFHLVRGPLHAAGHDVFTPSLTGIGERAHLTSPQVDLSLHVQDVVNQVLYEDLDEIVLLGFSYGGMVVTGCLDHIGDRVRHLVYLDAFVPADGQSLFALVGAPTPALGVGVDWLVPSAPASSTTRSKRRSSCRGACRTRSAASPSRSTWRGRLEAYDFERTYIRATADASEAPGGSAFDVAAERARSSPAWHYHEIATNHMIASNRPAELVELLLAMA